MKLQNKIDDLRREMESAIWRKVVAADAPIKVQSEDLTRLNPDGAAELMARSGYHGRVPNGGKYYGYYAVPVRELS